MDEVNSPNLVVEEAIQGLMESCARMISDLERDDKDGEPSMEYLRLWSLMGAVSHHLGKSGNDVFHRLEQRLLRLLTNTNARIISRLEEGIRETLSKMDRQYRETSSYYSRNALGSSLTSYEFNDYGLLGLRDMIGYTDLYMRRIKRELSSEVVRSIMNEDEKLRELLPNAIRQFRENRDDPTPLPEHFPESFWWRKIDAKQGRAHQEPRNAGA